MRKSAISLEEGQNIPAVTAIDIYLRSIVPSNAFGCLRSRSYLITNDSMRFFVVVIFGHSNGRVEVDLLCGCKVP